MKNSHQEKMAMNVVRQLAKCDPICDYGSYAICNLCGDAEEYDDHESPSAAQNAVRHFPDCPYTMAIEILKPITEGVQ